MFLFNASSSNLTHAMYGTTFLEKESCAAHTCRHTYLHMLRFVSLLLLGPLWLHGPRLAGSSAPLERLWGARACGNRMGWGARGAGLAARHTPRALHHFQFSPRLLACSKSRRRAPKNARSWSISSSCSRAFELLPPWAAA